MELKYETWLYDCICVADFENPDTPAICLGVITEEDLGCIMDIAAKQGHWVVTRPAMAETEES
jgi:hypothetical protein